VLGLLVAACETTPNMTPGRNGFLGMPWPNDIRKTPAGTIDLRGFPGSWNAILDTILSRGAAVTEGFGTNSGVLFQMTGPVQAASLPGPQESTASDSPAMLVDIDPASPERGGRIPLRVGFRATATLLRPFNVLTLLPYPGFVLRERTTYAAILFDGLRGPAARPLRPAPLLARLDAPWDPTVGLTPAGFAALRAQRDAVYDYVEAETAWTPANVVGFTVYTTQDTTAEMEAIAAAFPDLPDPSVVTADVVEPCGSPSGVTSIQGFVDMPRWQEGDSPYLDRGGSIPVGADAKAIVQGWERTKYEIVFPCAEAPTSGWPIIVNVNGTGAPFTTASRFVRQNYPPPFQLRYAVMSISPYQTGDRTDPEVRRLADRLEELGIDLGDVNIADVAYFNYLNPLAGRNNQRQQAADAMWLKEVARTFSLPAAAAGAPSDLTTDDDVVTFFGHSQGATAAPLFMSVDPDFDAAFLSAPGAGLYHALLHRGDIRPIVEALAFASPRELDDFHPAVQAVQTLAEDGDAANYAGAMMTPHVLMTEGILDGCSTRENAEHLATAAGFPVAEPVLSPVFGVQTLLGIPTVALPASGNAPGGTTRLLLQLDAQHFGVQANPQLVRAFFDGLLSGAPVVPAGPFTPERNNVSCVRHD
jgi:hypothetical protein